MLVHTPILCTWNLMLFLDVTLFIDNLVLPSVWLHNNQAFKCVSALFFFSPAVVAVALFFSLVGGHTYKVWISAVVRNKDGERRRRGPQAFWWKGVRGIWSVERERVFCQSSVAEQVWLGASLGTVPTRRQCVASPADNSRERRTDKQERGWESVFLWGCLELTGRF